MVEPRRVFAPAAALSDGAVVLEGELLRHLRVVLRLAPGDEFTVTDGAGAEYRARVENLGRAAGRARLLSRAAPARESALQTVLAQALPKGDRLSFVLEKAVELGVSAIRPLVSARTVGTRGAGAGPERWRRIVESAVAQSGRTRLPVLHEVCRFEELLADPDAPALRLLLWEHATEGLRAAVAGRAAPSSLLLAVGPEGGWSEQEVEQAGRAGFTPVRLGPRTLRTDTAGIAALAIVQSAWGDMP